MSSLDHSVPHPLKFSTFLLQQLQLHSILSPTLTQPNPTDIRKKLLKQHSFS